MGAGAGPQRPSFGRDALGLVLLLLACFFGVAAAMAYIDPRDQATGMTGLVMALVEFLGISCFFLAAGLGWIGFRLWIRGVDGKAGRDLFGVGVTTLTFAVLVGSLSPELGGTVGSIGAIVTAQLTVFVGLIFGVMVVLLPAWFLWLRPAALAAGEVPRSSAPLSPRASDSSGVSQAEAEGLFPKVAPRPPAPRAVAPAESRAADGVPPATTVKASASAADPFAEPSAARASAAPATRTPNAAEAPKLTPPKVVAASPYPPDVRREGRVPEGARPLGGGSPLAAPASSIPVQAAPVRAPQPAHEQHSAEYPRHAQALRVEPSAAAAGAGLVADELRRAVPTPVADEGAVQRGAALEPLAGPAGVAARGDAAPGALTRTLADALAEASSDEGASDETFDPPMEPASRVAESTLTQPLERTPPKPSWEQSDLFEEPVDAYGTPLALVEKLRGDRADGDAAATLAEPVSRVDQPLPWSADEDLGDEVIEDSIRPLATTTPVDDQAAPARAETISASGNVAGSNEPVGLAVPADEAPELGGPVASTPAHASAGESAEELRAQLRGFIDLRERSSAASTNAGDDPAGKPSASESSLIESPAAESPLIEPLVQEARLIEPEVVTASALELHAATNTVLANDAQVREARAESTGTESLSAPTPETEPALGSDETPQAVAERELAPELEPELEPEHALPLGPTPEHEASHAAPSPAERTIPAVPRPQVVIRSLFEEPATNADAPVADPLATPVEVATPSADVTLDIAAADAQLEPVEETAPLAVSDVVLEPVRRGKRKPKAPRTEADAQPAPATAPAIDSGANDAARSHETERDERSATTLASDAEHESDADLAPMAANEARESIAAQGEAASRSLAGAALATAVAPEGDAEVEAAPAKPRSRSRVTVDEVVFKAGCLFVERQRVAVSMLQREFGLDFDAATAVLDQLQRLGLIGPYLGGQRRDILLSMDEWQELVGVE